jgi:hypothetical protein
MSRFRPSLATATLAALVLSGPAAASILQIDRTVPTNANGTGGYVQRTGNFNDSFSGIGTATTTEPQFNDITVSATLGRTGASGSNSLLYSFNLTSQANFYSQQSLSTVIMQLVFSSTTVATLDITTRTARSGDQFRYAEVLGSAQSVPSGDWNFISSTGQFSNTFAAGTYTFLVEFYNSGGGGLGATQLAGTWSFASSGGGGGGVPLPGAAGLAACGLLGLARRRRR